MQHLGQVLLSHPEVTTSQLSSSCAQEQVRLLTSEEETARTVIQVAPLNYFRHGPKWSMHECGCYRAPPRLCNSPALHPSVSHHRGSSGSCCGWGSGEKVHLFYHHHVCPVLLAGWSNHHCPAPKPSEEDRLLLQRFE